MPSDADYIATIKTAALAALAAALANPKPSYNVDGQQVSHDEHVKTLQGTVDWANSQLAAEDAFEVVTYEL